MERIEAVLVLTTVGSPELGETIARALVDGRLAACVNVLPAMASTYRWKGQVERDTEHQLIVKTTAARAPAVERRIRELHSYELPEFLVIPIGAGGEPYLRWIAESVQ